MGSVFSKDTAARPGRRLVQTNYLPLRKSMKKPLIKGHLFDGGVLNLMVLL